MDYVKIEKDTGELILELPEEYKVYEAELQADLSEEFAFESMTKDAVEHMNQYVSNWLLKKGRKTPSV